MGFFWNFANPTIQVLTYWLVVGVILSGRSEQDGVPYICWLLGGMVVWFFISPCITNGCNAIYAKKDIIIQMDIVINVIQIVQHVMDHGMENVQDVKMDIT